MAGRKLPTASSRADRLIRPASDRQHIVLRPRRDRLTPTLARRAPRSTSFPEHFHPFGFRLKVRHAQDTTHPPQITVHLYILRRGLFESAPSSPTFQPYPSLESVDVLCVRPQQLPL